MTDTVSDICRALCIPCHDICRRRPHSEKFETDGDIAVRELPEHRKKCIERRRLIIERNRQIDRELQLKRESEQQDPAGFIFKKQIVMFFCILFFYFTTNGYCIF